MDSKNPPTSSAASKSPIAAAALVEWTNRLNADTFVPWHLQQPANASLGNGPSVNGTAANGTAANGTTVNGTAANEEFFDDEIVGFVTVKLPIYRSHRSLTAVYVHPYEPKEPELIPKEVEVLPGKFAPPLELPEEVIGTFRPVSGEKTLTRAVSFFTAPYEMDQENWEISNVVIHHTMPSFCGCGHVEPSEFHHANFAKAIDEEKNRPMEGNHTNSVQKPSAEVPVQPDAMQETPILGDSSRKKQPDEPPAKVLKKDQLDALFSEGDSITLPGFGRVTRSEVEQNMERYSDAIFQEQDVVFASIQNKEASTKASEEEGFQTVSKKNSFDPAKLTENQQEALKKAEQETRQEQHAAQVKAKAVGARPDVVSEPPCSSNKPTSSANSGASTPKSGKKTKRGKNKNTAQAVDEDMEALKNAPFYNMNVMLNSYYEYRRAALQNKIYLENRENEEDCYTFNKLLIASANSFPSPLNATDKAMKKAISEILLTHVSAMQLSTYITEERRKQMITFYTLLDTRDDDILVIDLATLEELIRDNEKETATYLWYYFYVCLRHSHQYASHDGDAPFPPLNIKFVNSDEHERSEHEVSPDAEKDEVHDEAHKNMVDRLEAYYSMRRKLRETRSHPHNEADDTDLIRLEKVLIRRSSLFKTPIREKDYEYTKSFRDELIEKKEKLGLTKEQQVTLVSFFKYLVDSANEIFVIDCHVLGTILKDMEKGKCKHSVWDYFQICMNDDIEDPLPTDK